MFQVTDLKTGESHGEYDTLDLARGCVEFDRLEAYQIWRGHMEAGEFAGVELVACVEVDASAAYRVVDLATGKSHGAYETLDQARGCVEFDRLAAYQIWRGHWEDGDFCGDDLVVSVEPEAAPAPGA
jgi:hypothetical protein